MRLTTRNALLQFVVESTDLSALRRAIHLGEVAFYGGFIKVPPGESPGWIFRIKSEWGRVWHVAILADDSVRRYRLRYLEQVPWRYWDVKQPIRHDLMTVTEVRKYLEIHEGVTRAKQTVHNWMKEGLVGLDGEAVTLQHEVKAKVYYTTRTWLEEFLDKVGLPT